MKKKTLIFMKKFYLKPIGGPSGYLFNLNSELERLEAKNISFINVQENHSNARRVIKKLPKFFVTLINIYRRRFEYGRLINRNKNISKIKLEDYDIIHFHNTKDMYSVKDSLSNYEGIVILTSHSPKPLSLEIYQDQITALERIIFKKFYSKLLLIDEYAFNRADYVIFPCEEAEEPYYNNWIEYKNIKEKNEKKFRYMLTGIKPCNARINKEEIRNKYNIPIDSFVISYVGRHNRTKGYDSLKIIGEEVIKLDRNAYFLIAGKEEPLKALNDNQWIEAGWTNDPYSIIAASDVFVLPNKETYFDIVMLEVLSLGKIVVASNTGGNKYFEKIDSKGIFLYNSIDEAVQLINKIKTMKNEERYILEKSNLDLFHSEFTSEKMAKNYMHLLEEL